MAKAPWVGTWRISFLVTLLSIGIYSTQRHQSDLSNRSSPTVLVVSAMNALFVLAIIGFIGLAVVYVSLRLPDVNPRKRFGKPTADQSKPSKPLHTSASRTRGRYMEIVGQPHTDISIYFSDTPRQPNKRCLASRHQVEKLVGDQLGITSPSSPLENSYDRSPSSASEISTDELDRYPSMSPSEQKKWRSDKLDGVSEKQQVVNNALSQLTGSPA